MVSMHTSPSAQPGIADAGGMNVTLLAIAAQLAIRGVEVDLLTRATGEPAVTPLLPGVTLRSLAAGESGPLRKEDLASVSDAFGEEVARLTGRAAPRYDLIHAHYWLSGIAVLPVAIELGLPFVQSFHTLAAMKNMNQPVGAVLEPEARLRSETFLSNQANAVVASSAAEASALIDDVGAPSKKVWVIPPGVDLELFTPERRVEDTAVRRKLGLERGRQIVAVIGRVQPLKGQDLAIRALAELRALRGWAPLLVIAGESTPGGERFVSDLHALVDALGVAADVRFVGALDRETLADLLACTAVTLVPSHSETFGLVALESAASGTPVIGSRSSGLLESVAEGESGILLESRDPRVWAVELSVLFDDPLRLSRIGATARDHAEHFSWATSATSLLGVYASLG